MNELEGKLDDNEFPNSTILNLYFDTDNLKVTDATVSNSLTVKNNFIVDTTKLRLNSSDGEIFTKGKITAEDNIEGKDITGDRVFGAVWM